jgi:hypothetical protein
MHPFKFLSFLALSSLSLASALRKDQYCFDAVYEALADLSFVGNTADEYWNSTCQNPLKVTSMYASAKTYCTPHEIEAGVAVLAKYCFEYGTLELAPMSQFADNLTDDFIKGMRMINYQEIPETDNITELVVMSPTYFGGSLRTVVSNYLPRKECLILISLVYMGVRNVDTPYSWFCRVRILGSYSNNRHIKQHL